MSDPTEHQPDSQSAIRLIEAYTAQLGPHMTRAVSAEEVRPGVTLLRFGPRLAFYVKSTDYETFLSSQNHKSSGALTYPTLSRRVKVSTIVGSEPDDLSKTTNLADVCNTMSNTRI